MKRIVLIGTLMMLLVNTPASAWIDFFGKNKERKLNFANQVISEVLTPEEMSQKVRIEESSKADGNHISIVDVLSGEYPCFKSALSYDLNLLFREISHEDLLKLLKISFRNVLGMALRERKKEIGEYTFKILSENPKDIISISEGYEKNSESKMCIVCISRNVRIGKWKSSLAYFSEASELTEEKKKDIIERLKNSPSINSWIAKSKKS